MKVGTHKNLDQYLFESQKEFEAWLDRHWSQTESIWLWFAKKKSPKKSVSYEEARETAIRYGWIDGLINKVDEDYYQLRFSKRRPKSTWSKINVAIADQLISENLMKENGLKEVEAAKKDGRWQKAY